MVGKISELTALTTPADGDEVEIRDISELSGTDAQNKRLTKANLQKELSPYSYIVFKVGATINARNTSTGSIEFSGTSAGAILQSCADALTAGGIIYIKTGTYTITTADKVIITTPDVNFIGEGKATVLVFNPGTGYALQFGDTVSRLEGGSVRNLKMTGETTNGENQMIRGNKSDHVVIRDLWIEDVGDEGIQIDSCTYWKFDNVHGENVSQSDSGGALIVVQGDCKDCMHVNCTVDGSNGRGFHCGPTATQAITQRIAYVNCIARDVNGVSGSGFVANTTDNGVEDVTYTNCIAENCDFEGFRANEGGGGGLLTRISYTNCIVLGGGSDASARGGFIVSGTQTPEELKNVRCTGCHVFEYGITAGESNKHGFYNIPQQVNCSAIRCQNSGFFNAIDKSIFMGCTALDNGQGGAGIRAGFDLAGDNQMIIGNRSGNTGVLTTQNRGIEATGTDQIIIGNDFTNNNSTNLDIDSATTPIVKDNKGHNPVGISAITVTASPFAYTAGVHAESVYISAGTVSLIVKSATTLFVDTGHSIELEANETITVTYSVLPTMIKDEH